jgi:hypothetical protein
MDEDPLARLSHDDRDSPALRRALGLLVLGAPTADIKMALLDDDGSGPRERTVDQWLAPGKGVLGRAFYEWDPSQIVAAARNLGLFGWLAELGIGEEEATHLLRSAHAAPDRTREGVVLRALLHASGWQQRQRQPGRRGQSVLFEEWFGLPGRVLLGDGVSEYRRSGEEPPTLEVEYSTGPWTPQTDPLIAQASDPSLEEWLGWGLWALGWQALGQQEAAERSAWNGELVRLAGLTQVSDEAHRLRLQCTCYVAQMATCFLHRSWGVLVPKLEQVSRRAVLADDLQRMVERREREIAATRASEKDSPGPETQLRAARKIAQLEHDIADLRDALGRLTDPAFPTRGLSELAQARLRDEHAAQALGKLELSRFANALSVNLALVSADDVLLLQQRNKDKVGAGLVDWQTTAAGFLSPVNDLDGWGRPSIWRAMEREAGEEFGRELSGPVLGVFWESRSLEVGVLAFAQSSLSIHDIHALPREPTEVSGFVEMPFEADTVFEFACDPDRGAIRRPSSLEPHRPPRIDPWGNVMPLGAAAIVFALAHDLRSGDSSWDELARRFKEKLEQARRQVTAS